MSDPGSNGGPDEIVDYDDDLHNTPVRRRDLPPEPTPPETTGVAARLRRLERAVKLLERAVKLLGNHVGGIGWNKELLSVLDEMEKDARLAAEAPERKEGLMAETIPSVKRARDELEAAIDAYAMAVERRVLTERDYQFAKRDEADWLARVRGTITTLHQAHQNQEAGGG